MRLLATSKNAHRVRARRRDAYPSFTFEVDRTDVRNRDHFPKVTARHRSDCEQALRDESAGLDDVAFVVDVETQPEQVRPNPPCHQHTPDKRVGGPDEIALRSGAVDRPGDLEGCDIRLPARGGGEARPNRGADDAGIARAVHGRPKLAP